MSDPIVLGSNQTTPVNPTERAIGDIIAMQLAAITYCSLTNNVPATLKNTLPDWTVAWIPTKPINGNWAFIAYNQVQYVVAIRGSILKFSWGAFDNWIEQDFNLLFQAPFTYSMNPAAKPQISQGASDGLDDLINLVDANGVTMLDFLMTNAVPKKSFIATVGHSLGGNLATVYSMFLRYNILKSGNKLPAIFSVLTFAAPSSWNKAFADEFDTSLTNTWRYFGELDIVPFSACYIKDLGALYPPAPLAKDITVTYKGVTYNMAEAFTEVQKVIAFTEKAYNSYYTPVNRTRGSIPLNTDHHMYPMTMPFPVEKWFEQAGEQHDHNHYLDWMGGKEVECG